MHFHRSFTTLLLAFMVPCVTAQDSSIPRPDGKPADMSKPVQVFIMGGQSNMIGFGKIQADGKGGPAGSLEAAVKDKKKYTYLVD